MQIHFVLNFKEHQETLLEMMPSSTSRETPVTLVNLVSMVTMASPVPRVSMEKMVTQDVMEIEEHKGQRAMWAKEDPQVAKDGQEQQEQQVVHFYISRTLLIGCMQNLASFLICTDYFDQTTLPRQDNYALDPLKLLDLLDQDAIQKPGITLNP